MDQTVAPDYNFQLAELQLIMQVVVVVVHKDLMVV
jgi:hypothetical protein